MRKHHEGSGNHTAVRGLDALSDNEVHHGWLCRLSKHHGLVFSNEGFVEAVRVRLGCAGPTDPSHALASVSVCLTAWDLTRHAALPLRAPAATTVWLSSFSRGFSSVARAQRVRWVASYQERICTRQTS